jgi:Tfp pilus assembly protein PilX
MDLLVLLLVAVLLGVTVAFVAAPLRRAAGAEDDQPRRSLEAAKEAKYREIRDAELDYRTGKLSEEDFRALDATLRVEATEILAKLDALEPRA